MREFCKKLLVGIMTVALVFSAIPPIQAHAGTIDEPEVAGIIFEDQTVFEGTQGRESETEDGDVWYFYDFYNQDYTVEFSDGSFMTREELNESYGESEEYWAGSYGFYYDGKYYNFEYSSEQSADAPWAAGETHEVTVDVITWDEEADEGIDVCSAVYSMEIVALPIEEIVFEPMQKVANSDGYWDYDWVYDEETGDEYATDEYFRYYYENWYYTVKFSDGTEDFVHDYDFDVQGFYYNDIWIDIELDSNQSYENQWEPGNTYAVDVKAGTYKTTYDVEIINIPIESIEFEPIEKTVETGGYWDYDWVYDEEIDEEYRTDEYFRYYVDNYNYTVKFSDGTEDIVRTEDNESTGFYYNDAWVEIYFDSGQNFENQWKAGNTYKVKVTAAGYSTTYDFKVLETPIKSIDVGDIVIKEKTGGYYETYYDGNSDKEQKWFRYRVYVPNVPMTVTMKDGTVYETDIDGDIRYNGTWIHGTINDTQSYEQQWGVGEHEVTMSILGYDQKIKVTIVCANHKWDNGTVTEAATCTSKGVKTFKCTNGACKETKTELIPAKGHVPGAAATCTDAQVCTVCNVQLAPAKGHTAGAEATCTTAKTCTTCGAELEKIKGHSVALTEKTRATVEEDGEIVKTCFCGETLETIVIKGIGKVSLNKTTFVYDGKAKAPKLTVKDVKGNAIDAANYEVTAPKSVKNVGTYTYTVKFKGDYAGKQKLTVTVNPAKPVAKKPVAAKKALTAKWGKVAKQATGYEVMVATNKGFTKNKKVVTVKNFNKTSVKVTNLKAKTKYFVKVRTYKTVNGKKYYSAWSAVKNIKTK